MEDWAEDETDAQDCCLDDGSDSTCGSSVASTPWPVWEHSPGLNPTGELQLLSLSNITLSRCPSSSRGVGPATTDLGSTESLPVEFLSNTIFCALILLY